MATVTQTSPTSEQQPVTIVRLLADYETRRTGGAISNEVRRSSHTNAPPGSDLVASHDGDDNEEYLDPSTALHPRVPGVVTPSWWPNHYRSIPHYAPINGELDFSERPTGENAVIGFLLTMTFTGCSLMSNYAWMCRNTIGRVNSKIFHYEIGGEY